MKWQILIILTIFVVLLAAVLPVFAVSDSINVGQQVTAVCNNNGICEPALGENNENCPLDCPAEFPPGGGRETLPPIIYDLFISKITLTSADIEWKTNEPALCQLFWGKTLEYKEGSISEIVFSLSHKTKLTNLLPETAYHFKIKCRDQRDNETETIDQRFTTLTPPDITPPANVSNFEAIPGNSQITLKWKNPSDPDFKAVRIMRSEKFYPRDPWEGELVYDDRETSFVDTGLTNGKRYYYTAFSYDFSGNFSSGAIVSAVPRLKPPPPPEEIFTEGECLEAGYYWYDDACHLEPKIVPPPPEVEKITIDDFDFIQAEKKIPVVDGKLEIKKEEPLKILINYDKVPEVLKTITVTLEKGEKFFSFLLRINKEKTVYSATLMPPDEPGVYPITITVLDFKNQVLKKIISQLIVFRSAVLAVPVPWYKNWQNWIYIIIIILFILTGMIYFIRKIKEKRAKIKNKNKNKNIV